MITYMKDQELPARQFAWKDGNGNLIDFSTGYTFSARICAKGATALLATKSTGIVGAATSPNITITWTASDFTALPAGQEYVFYIYARQTATALDDVYNPGNPPGFALLAAPA